LKHFDASKQAPYCFLHNIPLGLVKKLFTFQCARGGNTRPGNPNHTAIQFRKFDVKEFERRLLVLQQLYSTDVDRRIRSISINDWRGNEWRTFMRVALIAFHGLIDEGEMTIWYLFYFFFLYTLTSLGVIF